MFLLWVLCFSVCGLKRPFANRENRENREKAPNLFMPSKTNFPTDTECHGRSPVGKLVLI